MDGTRGHPEREARRTPQTSGGVLLGAQGSFAALRPAVARGMTLVALALNASSLGAQGAPATDIYLVPLGANLNVGKAVNITSRPGYDNQPSFTPDGRSVLYTSTRDDGQ